MSKQYNKNDFMRKELIRRLMRRFYIRLGIYTGCLILFFVSAYAVCAGRTWYGYEPFYPLIHFVHEHWFGCFMLCLVVGFVLFSLYHFREIIRMLEYVLDAVNSIYREQEELVELPEDLYEVEKEINNVILNVKTSKQRAREAEQKKNDLVVYMAHDLKTPLTSVIGYLSLLHEEKGISEEQKDKYIDIALRKSERLEELINEFFDITRFNLSTMTLELSTVNLTRMLEQLAYEFIPMFREKELTYRLDLENDLELVCDVEKMERVFDNLLKNAVNYSYHKTEIVISAGTKREEAEEFVEISITNRGKTIPKEKRERIFEQFFRLESSRDSRSGGAGLGLAIAKEIVVQHGGSLTCESENEKITFRLKLRKS